MKPFLISCQCLTVIFIKTTLSTSLPQSMQLPSFYLLNLYQKSVLEIDEKNRCKYINQVSRSRKKKTMNKQRVHFWGNAQTKINRIRRERKIHLNYYCAVRKAKKCVTNFPHLLQMRQLKHFQQRDLLANLLCCSKRNKKKIKWKPSSFSENPTH